MAYRQTEWIITNSTYFDTGYIHLNNTKVSVDIEPVDVYSSNNYYCGVFAPSYNSNATIGLNFYGNGKTRYYFGGKYNDYGPNYVVGKRYITTIDNSSFTITDVTATTSTTVNIGGNLISASDGYKFAIGAVYYNGGYNEGISKRMKFYDVSIYENNVLIHHYLPYKDTTTGYGLLYDEIDRVYLIAASPSSVEAGPEVSNFSLSEDSLTYTEIGGSQTVTLTSSDNDWTASTTNNWISVSPLTGTVGDTVITIVVQPNNWGNRIGTVSFTDGVDTISLSVSQKADTSLILKNLYMNGNKVPLMIRNGEIIYRMYTKLVFSVDTDSITFESSGGTYTINITANDNWSMTIPEFVTASSLTGTGNASITISTTGETTDTELTGDIVINCNGKTHTISVKQKSQKPDYSREYLTFEIIDGNNLACNSTWNGAPYPFSIDYKINNGQWNTLTITTSYTEYTIGSLSPGDKVSFRGNNSQYGNSGYDGFKIYSDTNTKYNISGNIMSMIYGDNFIGQTTISSNYAFANFFRTANDSGGEFGLISAENLVLPATTLSYSCYYQMFSGEKYLRTAPSKIGNSETTLADYCCTYMFNGCTSLTTAPELPATTLANHCYQSMFFGCTGLTSVENLILPATTLTSQCYYGMFENCTSLTTAPELPATTLASNCYYNMFYNCTSLTKAPELPATKLLESCYYGMFRKCSSLNYIKCLATDLSATGCLSSWVYGVASTGTFVKKSGVTWSSGTSGIPNGWTVEDAE